MPAEGQRPVPRLMAISRLEPHHLTIGRRHDPVEQVTGRGLLPHLGYLSGGPRQTLLDLPEAGLQAVGTPTKMRCALSKLPRHLGRHDRAGKSHCGSHAGQGAPEARPSPA